MGECFFEHCGAHIQHCMPCLVALADAAGVLRRAVDLRRAAANLLFLQRYLACLIEQLIIQKTRVA